MWNMMLNGPKKQDRQDSQTEVSQCSRNVEEKTIYEVLVLIYPETIAVANMDVGCQSFRDQYREQTAQIAERELVNLDTYRLLCFHSATHWYSHTTYIHFLKH